MPAAASPRVVLPTTATLDQLLLRAAWIGKGEGPTHVASFTSLFLAFLASHDEVSLWVQDKIGWIGPASPTSSSTGTPIARSRAASTRRGCAGRGRSPRPTSQATCPSTHRRPSRC